MSRDVVAQELFWYVLPEHRSGSDGIRLLKDFKMWAKAQKASLFVMATFHQEGANETLSKLYESQGLKPIETHYLEEL
jgi:GNAT superfamily N-acetyltransferase